MCGIVGTIGSREAVKLGTLNHRGPDASGSTTITLPWCAIRLGMTRLAIVDQTPFPVPMRFRNGVSIAFNGEIYNWRSLKSELSDGTPWETECDVEVVARGWRKWGTEILTRLNGMFAFVLVDELQAEVLLVRDRLGEKPLYISPQDGVLHFASEIKALPIKLEEVPCADMDVLEFDCGTQTPFSRVFRVPTASFALLHGPADLNPPRFTTWWRLPEVAEVDSYELPTMEGAVDEAQELIEDACRIRAVSEIPWTVAVSGGLDSAIVQAIVKCPRVYCVTFPEDGLDNLEVAKLAAPGAEIVPVTFRAKEALAALEDVAYHLDTPGTWSALGLWFMAGAMAKDGVKVVLNGEGADELAGGYSRYRLLWWLECCEQDPLLTAYRPTFEALHGNEVEIMARMLDRSPGGTARECAIELARHHYDGAGLVSSMERLEIATTMQVLLRMADRMYSSVGIENRAPFLDYRLAEFLAELRTEYKIDERYSKLILREVAKRLCVHSAIIEERTKRGLLVPWNKWFPPEESSRGMFGREGFSKAMNAAWRKRFFHGTS